MIKKFIFVFTIMLFTFGVYKVSAETYTTVFKYQYTNHDPEYYYALSDSCLNNTTTFTVNSKQFKKPVMVVEPMGTTQIQWNLYAKTNNNGLYVSADNIYASGNYTYGYANKNTAILTYLNDLVAFNNITDASNYSMGLTYNADNIVGGSVPIDYLIGLTERDNRIITLETNLYSTYSPNFFDNPKYNKGEFYFKVQQAYDLPEGAENHIMLNFNISIPTTTRLDYYWNEWFGDYIEPNNNLMRQIFYNCKNKGVNACYDSDGNKLSNEYYTTFNITYDLDYCVEQGLATVAYSQDLDSVGNIAEYVLTDRTFSNADSISSVDYIPKGITGILIAYYGNTAKGLFATNYININYISCWSYAPNSYMVYNPVNFYYPSQMDSSGNVYERRNFTNKTNITIDNIPEPEDNSNIVGDNTTPTVDVPQNTVDSLFNTSIQDSYNNITNNYYYDNGLTQNILDYYRGFSDGATDENIDSALGYVKGTLGSLSHIPLLLSYCFNAFFPLEIIRLFQALLIIFVVFMIIRIIKHLFTH